MGLRRNCVDNAIAGLDPQPTYRLRSSRGSQKRTMNYKLYLEDSRQSFKCIVKRGEVLEIQWPEGFDEVIAEQSLRKAADEVASTTN